MKSKTFFPKTDSQGVLKLSNPDYFFHFLKSNPSQRLRLTIEVLPEKTSLRLYYYYRYYVLQEVRNAFHNIGYAFSPDETDEQLRYRYTDAFYFIGDNGEQEILSFREAGNQRVILFLEQVKMFAAKNLNVVINDPE